MNLRLSGTEQECADAVAALASGWFDVRKVSGFYPNRGDSLLGRVYVDAEPVPDLAPPHDRRPGLPTADRPSDGPREVPR